MPRSRPGNRQKAAKLNNRVRRFRFDNDEMTQQQLADLAGVTRQTIIALEANRYAPSLPLAFRIARVFGVAIEEVFQYDEEPEEADSGQKTDNR